MNNWAVFDTETLLRLNDNSFNIQDEQWLKRQEATIWLFSFTSNKESNFQDVYNDPSQIINKLNEYEFVFFHNLSFDGNFIIKLLQANGFNYLDSSLIKKDSPNYTYTSFILGKKIFYISFKINNKWTTIKDSLKFLPFSVHDLAKSFNLPIEKEHVIDYNDPRFYEIVNHYPTRQQMPQELADLYANYTHYAVRDTEVVYECMKKFLNFVHEYAKPFSILNHPYQRSFLSTLGSLAFKLYQKMNPQDTPYLKIQNEELLNTFPDLENDKTQLEVWYEENGELKPNLTPLNPRQLYKGGLTIVNDEHKRTLFTESTTLKPNEAIKKIVKKRVKSFDLNSAYPAVLKNCFLPCSLVPKDGLVYVDDIVAVESIEEPLIAKTNLRPLFSSLGGNGDTSDGHPSKSTGYWYIWGKEWDHIKELYIIPESAIINRYPAYGKKFDEGGYVELFYNLKKQFKKTNRAFYQISKLFMNALTGKFGQNPTSLDNVYFSFDDYGVISKYENQKRKKQAIKLKTPIGDNFYPTPRKYTWPQEFTNQNNFLIVSYITSLTRIKIIEAILEVGIENWIYSDTDSIKILLEIYKNVGLELGEWEYEADYDEFFAIRPKCYKGDGEWTFGGVSRSFRESLTYDDVVNGHFIKAKLIPIEIKGGVFLMETFMEIKDD